MNARYDLLIRDAEVVDGTGAARFRADVGVRGDRIAAIGGLHEARADVEIDASGKAAAPGFIDAHTHDDRLSVRPRHGSEGEPGVTTVVPATVASVAPFPMGSAAGRPRSTTGQTGGGSASQHGVWRRIGARPPATNAARWSVTRRCGPWTTRRAATARKPHARACAGRWLPSSGVRLSEPGGCAP
jgi:N-acyl-D-amino-acid deacylase